MSRKSKRIITLVGVKQAERGFEFLSGQPSHLCQDCKYYGVCIENLEPGRVYRVVKLRDRVFDCKLHDGGVRVVEVEKSEILTAVSQKIALEGAVITFIPEKCGDFSCENFQLCHPLGLFEGDKCEISSIGKKIKCPVGLPLVTVKLRCLSGA